MAPAMMNMRGVYRVSMHLGRGFNNVFNIKVCRVFRLRSYQPGYNNITTTIGRLIPHSNTPVRRGDARTKEQKERTKVSNVIPSLF